MPLRDAIHILAVKLLTIHSLHEVPLKQDEVTNTAEVIFIEELLYSQGHPIEWCKVSLTSARTQMSLQKSCTTLVYSLDIASLSALADIQGSD